MPTTFAGNIKPYFTPCYRAHMLDAAGLDLWDKATVETQWAVILDRTGRPAGTSGSMPRTGCPEGVWDQLTRDQFQSDFQAWKNDGFQ